MRHAVTSTSLPQHGSAILLSLLASPIKGYVPPPSYCNRKVDPEEEPRCMKIRLGNDEELLFEFGTTEGDGRPDSPEPLQSDDLPENKPDEGGASPGEAEPEVAAEEETSFEGPSNESNKTLEKIKGAIKRVCEAAEESRLGKEFAQVTRTLMAKIEKEQNCTLEDAEDSFEFSADNAEAFEFTRQSVASSEQDLSKALREIIQHVPALGECTHFKIAMLTPQNDWEYKIFTNHSLFQARQERKTLGYLAVTAKTQKDETLRYLAYVYSNGDAEDCLNNPRRRDYFQLTAMEAFTTSAFHPFKLLEPAKKKVWPFSSRRGQCPQ